MSDKETRKKNVKTKESAAEPEKVMTKYDRKVQRRQEQKAREEKEKRIGRGITAAVIIALIALIASFPIRKYIATHETYIVVGGENITKAEFDYHFNVALNNYVNQYGSYLSYFGLDTSQDLSTQMYSDTMSWQDYFEEMAVDNLTQAKALKAEADAAGFTYDATEDIKLFKSNVKKSASEAETTVKKYLRGLYGEYATLSNISSYMENSLRESAYYQKVSDEKAPSEEEIRAYYEENMDDYDSVDYYQTIIEAELPTEPTELADPVEETDDAEAEDEDEEAEYEPSEAEIEKAMEDAKVLADAADPKAGELQENVKQSDASYTISDWLFDEERKEGDTTVIEDSSNNQYYVLSFEKRYLDESATADLRLIITSDVDGQVILDEWKAGAATEDSFIELYQKYSADAMGSTKKGLVEGVTKDNLDEAMSEWIFAEGRAAGDTTSIAMDSGYTYVIYYVGEGRPEWQNSIKSTLVSETMTTYIDEISANVSVEDKKNRLNYLKIRAEEEAAAAEEDEEEVDPEELGLEEVDLEELGLEEVDPEELELEEVE